MRKTFCNKRYASQEKHYFLWFVQMSKCSFLQSNVGEAPFVKEARRREEAPAASQTVEKKQPKEGHQNGDETDRVRAGSRPEANFATKGKKVNPGVGTHDPCILFYKSIYIYV